MKDEFNSLVDLLTYFNTQDKCKKYLASKRWSDGKIECPHCDHNEKIYKTKSGYKCSSCKKNFSVTKGTIYENSAVPLQKWFIAIWLVTSHKKGVSSLQLSRDINVTQKTAWYMLQRLREVYGNEEEQMLEGTVEADETYVGGLNKNRHKDKKVPKSTGRAYIDKIPVLGLIQRGGKIVIKVVPDVTRKTLQPLVRKYVKEGSNLCTDEWRAYNGLEKHYTHCKVFHGIKNYANGDVHTNTIESYWAILKRGYKGVYHYMSRKHISRYLNEFQFRFNNRHNSVSDYFNKTLELSDTRLEYKKLVA